METDSLYYIMDYSGHYYRTDKADQLVAVAGQQYLHLRRQTAEYVWARKQHFIVWFRLKKMWKI